MRVLAWTPWSVILFSRRRGWCSCFWNKSSPNLHYFYPFWLYTLCLLSSRFLWLLYHFKYLLQIACIPMWKTLLSSWEVRPERWGFPFASKTLCLLEFPCKWQFLLSEWNGWTFERWEMGLKDLCNKPWEVPFQCDWGSLLCGCVFALMKDLFPAMCSIMIRKWQIAWRKSEHPQ